MTIKVININGLAAYFPSQITYPNNKIDKDKRTIDGILYIEISAERHCELMGKNAIVENGEVRLLSSSENKFRSQKLSDDILAKMTYAEKRQKEYGPSSKQMENIIENGIEAEQVRVAAIKLKYPKI